MTYYFAYGSNLNKDQMRQRCPAAIPIGKLTLPNARLVFRGVADVEYADDASVAGGLWDITKRCEEALDRYEGVKNGLYRKEYITIRIKEKGVLQTRRALVYQMNKLYYATPSKFYVETIRKGYHDFGIDRALLAAAIEENRAMVAMCRQVDEAYAPRKAEVQMAMPLPEPKVKAKVKAGSRYVQSARREPMWYDDLDRQYGSDRMPFRDPWLQ